MTIQEIWDHLNDIDRMAVIEGWTSIALRQAKENFARNLPTKAERDEAWNWIIHQ